MDYFATFQEFQGFLLRFDTRIYLDKFDSSAISCCIGAIIGKNPGSAKPTRLNQFGPVTLNGDRMLPYVGHRFLEAYRLAGKALPSNAYVQVWNLFYLCDRDLGEALRVVAQLDPLPNCPTEFEPVPIVWFGWGGYDHKLNQFKVRFLQHHFRNGFYFNHIFGRIVQTAPTVSDFAKHTQGMPKLPVVEYLATVI